MAIFSHSSAEQIGIAISAGESFNLPCHTLAHHPIRQPTLPPAVANVPPEHIRGYVHNKKVNHYLVGSNLGEGSFAKVKEAFHTLVGEKVAMKVIDKKKALQDPYVAKNFRREAKLLQMVRHQNIIQLLEVIESDSSFYLITELCSGGELMKYIYKKGQLDERETNKFMRQIVSAVDHLHRAGIIHRDLKVENMLLDANMDIKIIDFGLSNEEYVEGETGLTHCTTQCGSPAYAAPELLGHKSYGPQVDIWSIGVNMYAMLTGCLPYTVEPFNITALHAKMLENKMNPIPDHLSAGCKDLLKQLLRSNPDERVKMPDIMKHSWMNEGHTLPFGPARFPNKLEYSDVNPDILQHMVSLKIRSSEEEMKQELITNRSTNSSAIYHLLSARLARYNRQFQSHPVRMRHKTRVSQDQGYYEGEDDDDRSVVSMPARFKKNSSTRQSSRTGGVVLRHSRPGGGKSRHISYPIATNEEEMEAKDEEDLRSSDRYRNRRQTMPEMMLKEDIAKVRMRMNKEVRPDGTSKPGKRPPSTHHQSNPPVSSSQRHKRESPPGPTKYTSIQETATLAPVRPPVRNQNAALNMIQDDLSKALPSQQSSPVRGGVMQAWHSNSSSKNPSRNPSRQGSRNHIKLFDTNDSMPIEDDCEGLEFHEVRSSTLPRSSSRKKSASIMGDSTESIPDSVNNSYLPAITEREPIPSWYRQRNLSEGLSQQRKNDYLTRSHATEEIRTELGVEEVLSEILRAARSLKIREVEKTSVSSVLCLWAGIKILVTVDKVKLSSCKLYYKWISGGDLNSYQEKCDKLSKKIRTYVIS